MNAAAIIVAGGRGLRMGTDLPKQFLPIGGRPVLMRTIEAFVNAIDGIRIVVVLPTEQQPFWHDLCRKHDFATPHTIADGGQTRFHSVLNGLRSLTQQPSEETEDSDLQNLVAIHDGVRPFVSADVIRRCFAAAATTGAAIPVVPVVETLRELTTTAPTTEPPTTITNTELPATITNTELPTAITNECRVGSGCAAVPPSLTRDRSRFRLVQTPQVFRLDILRRAYAQPYRDTFTDDASVVEALGQPITLVEGNRENIKLTTPFDLVVAEALCTTAE